MDRRSRDAYELRASGLPFSEIGRRYRVSETSANAWARQYALAHGRPWPFRFREQWAELCPLYRIVACGDSWHVANRSSGEILGHIYQNDEGAYIGEGNDTREPVQRTVQGASCKAAAVLLLRATGRVAHHSANGAKHLSAVIA